jgi:hypothetical protein
LRLRILVSFDFISLHIDTKAWAALQEELVIVTAVVGALGDALKSVEIELSLKRCQLRLFEKPGHDFFHKSSWLVDRECPSV